MTLVNQLRLMVITDAALLKGRDPVDVCRRAVAGGVTAVQVRRKGDSAADTVAFARALVAALPVPILVNDRVDLALAAGAAGAHLGQDDPPLAALRPHVPPGFVLGISVGSVVEAERAREWPADYWSVGPCFATATKGDAGPALGADGTAVLVRLSPPGVPVIGIGGITAATVGEVLGTGAVGVAVSAAVLGAADPRAASRALLGER
jgi:thiamine-phosphate pyrophosphorylase